MSFALSCARAIPDETVLLKLSTFAFIGTVPIGLGFEHNKRRWTRPSSISLIKIKLMMVGIGHAQENDTKATKRKK